MDAVASEPTREEVAARAADVRDLLEEAESLAERMADLELRVEALEPPTGSRRW
jgi:hypothetical protein